MKSAELLLKQLIVNIEQDTPLSMDQEAMLEDVCNTLGLDVRNVLGYRPSDTPIISMLQEVLPCPS